MYLDVQCFSIGGAKAKWVMLTFAETVNTSKG